MYPCDSCFTMFSYFNVCRRQGTTLVCQCHVMEIWSTLAVQRENSIAIIFTMPGRFELLTAEVMWLWMLSVIRFCPQQ